MQSHQLTLNKGVYTLVLYSCLGIEILDESIPRWQLCANVPPKRLLSALSELFYCDVLLLNPSVITKIEHAALFNFTHLKHVRRCSSKNGAAKGLPSAHHVELSTK